MKSKIWIIIIISVIILLAGFFILSKYLTTQDKEDIKEITYETDPNFYNLHPKGDQFLVGITGEEMNLKTLEENALIWGVDPGMFVSEFNSKFKTRANKNDLLGDVLPEYKNSNRDVKIILDGLK